MNYEKERAKASVCFLPTSALPSCVKGNVACLASSGAGRLMIGLHIPTDPNITYIKQVPSITKELRIGTLLKYGSKHDRSRSTVR